MNGILKIARAAAVAVVLALGAAAPTVASADNDSVCGAVLCLFGKATGHGGGSACNQYIRPYYSIKVFKHGVFRPDKTITKRLNFLKGCSSASDEQISVANSDGAAMFGSYEIPDYTNLPWDNDDSDDGDVVTGPVGGGSNEPQPSVLLR